MKTTESDMKTIVNKLRFALLLSFVAIGLTVLAQEIANIEKMSISTQMFLDELAGKYNFDRPQSSIKSSDGSIIDSSIRQHGRHIAHSENINGQDYISSFIFVSKNDDISIIESLGVIIENCFSDTLVTALIPVDKIQDLAAFDGVKRIEVATIMETTTDNARQTTNADDVLTLSNDAVLAGLQQQYDGSGVILGIIDIGIDFQHIAFKDKNGNSRVKGVYCCTTSDTPDYNWSGSGTLPTTDNSAKDHGSHTSAIAGGSSVIVNGTNITVTDDHANATYGGMAPGADLYLAGINTLYTTRITNALNEMVTYADEQNKPLVVSNSYGSTTGPHDGTSAYTSVVSNFFGNNHPNRIALFSTGNEAGGKGYAEGSGIHIYGTASSSNPLRSILRSHRYSNRDHGYCYSGDLASIWCQSTSVTDMSCRILVLDTSTGGVLKTVSVTPTSNGTEVTELSSYYSGTLVVYKDYNYSYLGKTQILLTATTDLKSRSYNTSNPDYYTSNYTLALEVYPTSGTARIDAWAADYCYFSDYLTTNGYNWVNGTFDMSTNDFANNPNIIPVGSYVSRERSSGNSLGDISKFSSYATETANPMGKQLPWITAPGEVIISAYNRYNTSRSSSYIVSVNNATSPYGQMSGTSMACPTAAGIVALWFQAARQEGVDLTLSQVKEIMKETAIRDYFVVSGPNSTHFGNGKINALAGIEYILNNFHIDPVTAGTVSPESLSFGDVAIGRSKSMTVTVTNTGNQVFTPAINTSGLPSEFTLTGNGEVYQNGTITLTVTYTPTTDGQQNGSFTITIGDQTYTVTVTANGFVINNTVFSNDVMVPAYHSDVQAGESAYAFTHDDVISDFDKHLVVDGSGNKVDVLVKNEAAIDRYDLKHRDGTEGNWTVVAIAQHQGDTFLPQDYNHTSQGDAVAFGDGETEMWMTLEDNVTCSNSYVSYIPVTVANGVITQGNTYGAPMMTKRNEAVNLDVIISGSKSDKRQGGHWINPNDEKEYCIYTTVVNIFSEDLDGMKQKPYMFRAWVTTLGDHPIYDFTRNENGAIVGTTPLNTPYLLGELTLGENEFGQRVVIGEEWDPNSYDTKLQNAFGAPSNNAQISVIVRAYYLPGNAQMKLSGNRDGLYGISESGGESSFDLPTGIADISFIKEIVGVTYVNAMGMKSATPFDGLNIVVTRYSDGTITSTKIFR
jgi:hypothetical protein